MDTKPLNVFVCFDDEDAKIVNLIEDHCAALVHTKKIEVWHHQKIRPGQLIDHERRIHLENADIILLMISSKLLNSEAFYEVEKTSLSKLQQKKTTVIPVLLKYAFLQGFEFTQLQMLPSDGEPVAKKGGDLNLRCKEVAIEIHRLVETLDEINYNKSKLNIPFKGKGETMPILFLTNHPEEANQRRLNREISSIKQRLVLGKCSCQYELVPKNFNTIEELQRALLETRPRIVHFSGYSTKENELVYTDEKGEIRPINSEALCSLFNIFSDTVDLVFLNACYSENQAKSISTVVKYVIGIEGAISDEIGLSFVNSFYQAISYGTSIQKAFKLGRNLLQLQGQEAFDRIKLLENNLKMQTRSTG